MHQCSRGFLISFNVHCSSNFDRDRELLPNTKHPRVSYSRVQSNDVILRKSKHFLVYYSAVQSSTVIFRNSKHLFVSYSTVQSNAVIDNFSVHQSHK